MTNSERYYFAVKRNNQIITLFAIAQAGYGPLEQLTDSDPDIINFISANGAPEQYGYTGAEPVPDEASSGNFVRALHELGWIGQVKAAVAQSDPLTQDLWFHAAKFGRYEPRIIQIAAALGKTDSDLDQLFRLAHTY